MEKRKSIIKIIPLMLNFLVLGMELVGTYHSFHEGGIQNLRYYTVLSNILAFIVSFLYVTYYILNFTKKGTVFPKWLNQLKFTTCTCLTVTFVVVITVLIPMDGIQSIDHYIFGSANIYHHVLCPIVMFFSFCVFEKERELTLRDNISAMIPTVIYALVMIILNLAKVLKGPYPFLYVYDQPIYISVIWAVVILALTYVLGFVLRVLNGRGRKTTVS